MTEDFIKIVKEEYKNWRNTEAKKINELNQKRKEKIEKWEEIHKSLQNEEVKKFAKNIGYIEEEAPEYLTLQNSLYDFLKASMSRYQWSNYLLKKDDYPIYCYIESHTPVRSAITGKKLYGYDDLYWNLQKPGYVFGPSDSKENGKNREKYRMENINNIIYPKEGESFKDMDTFYRVQTEYIEETLRTNQEQAKRKLLQKYSRKSYH